ncbi:MAG: hypothetical protein IJK31_10990 [Ruminococcus sp.]|nr:hypothetical protein [Ruminococcus sp.]HRR76490.1 hypothetical protein [Ruminococcus sp.]
MKGLLIAMEITEFDAEDIILASCGGMIGHSGSAGSIENQGDFGELFS